jgi:predicted phosphate transport protein (TIGR00153 family)
MAGSNILGNLFGRSPIGPIQEHMQIANQAVQLLPDLIRSTTAGDWGAAAELHKEIERTERAADKLKRSVRRHLPKSLFLPVPRSDLLSLVSMQDNVVNTARDIAVIIVGRTMRFPETMQDGVLGFTEACAATSGQALLAIQELDELLEVGFSGREVKRVEAMLKQLDKMERRTDKLATGLRAQLFKMEGELPPVDVMFYYSVLSLLGTVADEAKAVGDRLQVLIAR